MTLIPDIAFDNTEPSRAVEDKIKEKVNKLEKHFDRLTYVKVIVAAPNRLQHKPKAFQVKITLGMPGRPDLIITSDADLRRGHDDVYAALRDAFEAARRRLDESAERLRGEVKTHVNYRAL